MAKYLYDRRIETNRDYDDVPNEGLGLWNMDWEFPVPPRHLDLKMVHEDTCGGLPVIAASFAHGCS